jgi:hypothetical protein
LGGRSRKKFKKAGLLVSSLADGEFFAQLQTISQSTARLFKADLLGVDIFFAYNKETQSIEPFLQKANVNPQFEEFDERGDVMLHDMF